MLLPIDERSVVVFDLDDTLYKERDFVRSGFEAVLSFTGHRGDMKLLSLMHQWQDRGNAVMSKLAAYLGNSLSPAELVAVYRFHTPRIDPSPGALEILAAVLNAGGSLGLVTDGRSRTQRAKLTALGIGECFHEVVVSEEVGNSKPDPRNFELIQAAFLRCTSFAYIADNPTKDFVAPNRLGWATIQLDDDGRNVHPQPRDIPADYAAIHHISSLQELMVEPR